VEYRLYQEISTNQGAGKIKTQHRFRAEARFFKKFLADRDTTVASFNFRFRYRLSFSIPLLSISERHPAMMLFLNLGDELLINAGPKIIYNTFDNNRFFVGLNFQANNKFGFTITYINQFGQRNFPATYEQSDILTLGISHTLMRRNKLAN
jgi:hypothetical protein